MATSLTKSPVKIVVIVIAVILGALLGKYAFDAYAKRPGGPEAAFEKFVETDPNMGPMFQAFRQYFPNDYNALKTEVIAQYRAGADQAAVNMIGFTRMAAFRKAHTRDLAQAPAAEFHAFRKAQADLMHGLAAESQTMCAQYAFSTLQPTNKPSPKVQKLIADFGTIQFQAIAAGQKTPAKRELSAPTEADSKALVEQMKREGIGDSQLATFLGQPGGTPMTEADQCKTGVMLIDALGKLPEEQADRVTAFLTAQS